MSLAAEIGEPAPHFELNSSSGDSVSLEEHFGKGPTVLLFVPLAFTPVCTNELRIVRDDFDFYTGLSTRVLGTSVDSQYTLKIWAEQLKLPFELLSDFNKETAASYGALYEELGGLRGVAKRAAFVIDKDGIIRFRWVSEDASVLPPFDKIKAAVEEAAAT